MAVHPLDHARIRTPHLGVPARRVLSAVTRLVSQVATRAQASSRPVRARLGYSAGVAVTAWGMGVQFGLGWALMTGGIVASVSFLLLYPVEGQ